MPQTTRFTVFMVIWVRQLHGVCQLGLPSSYNGWNKAPLRKLHQVGFKIFKNILCLFSIKTLYLLQMPVLFIVNEL